MKQKKIIWTGIGVDNHLIITAGSVVLTHRVSPKTDKIRKVMISLDMGSHHRLVPYLEQVEVVLSLETEIEQLEPNTEAVKSPTASTLVAAHLAASNQHHQHPNVPVTSSTQHWKFRFKRKTKKEAQTTINKGIQHQRHRMTDLIYCLSSTILRMLVRIIINNTIACTIM